MFSFDTPAVRYTDPWVLPLPERLAMLARGKRRIAYYYEAANNSTFRYRAYNMAHVLNDQPEKGVSASWFHRSDLDRVDEIADLADQLVICRSGYDHTISRLVARFRARGKPILFDIDDFVFDTRYTQLVVQTLALDMENPGTWQDWFGWIGRAGDTLRLCDGAITTNAFLAQRIHEYCGLPVTVVPNFMNREQLDLSARVYAEKRSRHFAGDARLCAGYFSGSPSHRLDYALAEPAMEALLEAHPDLHLMLVGYIEPGPGLARFGNRILREPFYDYVNLQRLIGSVEFNLMPLQCNAFTDSKSELKYFEAAAVGTLSIASPSQNYAASIRHGHNGYLARAHQWERVIAQALSQMDGYAEMAERAHDDAIARFSWTGQYETVCQALQLR
jgi:glycosyltransferase involved in cell wall biosynthesis